MRREVGSFLLGAVLVLGGCATQHESLESCVEVAERGLRPVAEDRSQRFLGKVREDTARCRGGERAVEARKLPWVDWQNYWATGDASSRSGSLTTHLSRQRPGRRRRAARPRVPAHGADQVQPVRQQRHVSRTTCAGATASGGPALKVWHADAAAAGRIRTTRRSAATGRSMCSGELIRFRTLTGICNDIRNPLMGSTRQLFARNVQFEATFPELGSERARAQPPRRPPRAAHARSAGDQPQAVHARRSRSPTTLQRGPRPAGLARPTRLRLQEGAVLQRARGVLDPVHDARLVLAPAGGRTTSADDAVGCGPARDGATAAHAAETQRSAAGPDDRIDRGLRRAERHAGHASPHGGQDRT